MRQARQEINKKKHFFFNPYEPIEDRLQPSFIHTHTRVNFSCYFSTFRAIFATETLISIERSEYEDSYATYKLL